MSCAPNKRISSISTALSSSVCVPPSAGSIPEQRLVVEPIKGTSHLTIFTIIQVEGNKKLNRFPYFLQACPQRSKNFRDVQCGQYNGRDIFINGERATWRSFVRGIKATVGKNFKKLYWAYNGYLTNAALY